MDEGVLRGWADFLHCRVGDIPFHHLGIPVEANMNKASSWRPVVETFERRLSLWKANHLFMGGRLILVKSVLNALPVYFFSLYKAPKKIISKLESLRMNFLWGGSSDKNKIHWVRRDLVTRSIKNGGLGLSPLEDVNYSLLAKWIWRYKVEPFKLWRKIIYSIHDSNRRVSFIPCNKSFSGNWKMISSLYGELITKGVNLRQRIQLIGSKWCWDGDPTGWFTTSSLRRLLEKPINRDDEKLLSWCKIVPKKINTFIWKALRGRIGTMDELTKRGIPIVNELCPLCGDHPESVIHLLVSCYFTSTVWEGIARWCKLPPIFAFEIDDLFNIYKQVADKRKATYVQAIIFVTCWMLWRERNTTTFKNRTPSIAYIIKEIKSYSFLWIKYRSKSENLEWKNWCNFIL